MGIYRVSSDSWGRQGVGDMATLPPRGLHVDLGVRIPFREACVGSTWLAWTVEGFGIQLIFRRLWNLKELPFKPQTDLMGPLVVGSDELPCDSISRCLPPAIPSCFSEL